MPSNNKKINHKAFSLIEISVVVSIVAILIAGIFQGKSLINEMRLASARSITENSPILSIEGLRAWYDSVMENSLAIGTTAFVDKKTLADKQAIGRWNDINTNILPSLRNYAVQANALYQPLYYEVGINGLPALYFDGVDDHIVAQINNIAGNYFIDIQNNFTYFVVAYPQDNCIAGSMGTSGQKYAIYPLHAQDRFGSGWNRVSVGLSICKNYIAVVEHTASYMPLFAGNSRVINRPIIVTVKYENRIAYLYINGILFATSGTNSYFPSPSLSFGGGRPFTGSGYGYGEHYGYYKGFIGELMLYQNSLNDLDRVSVEDYLKEKWQIK